MSNSKTEKKSKASDIGSSDVQNERPPITIHGKPVGQNGSAMLTVLIDNDLVAHEKIDLSKSKERSKFATDLANKYPELDREEVEKELLQIAASLSSPNDECEDEECEPTREELLQAMPEHVVTAALETLKSPELVQQIVDDVEACGVTGEKTLALTIYLIGVSRLLSQPLSGIVQAPSSTGKSYLLEKVAELFPQECVVRATAITPKALLYAKPDSLCHKFIIGGERSRRQDDETADATKMLREMISSGRISQYVTGAEGNREAENIEQNGPIAYVETTTVGNIFNEDANRCLLLATDERPEQTVRIVEQQAKRYSCAVLVNIEPIIQHHHALQRLLKPLKVVIPYAEEVSQDFKKERVEARRAFPHFMRMVQASALLHQYQRDFDDEGRIVANQFDLELAECLCRRPLARLLDGDISDAALRFLERLKTWDIRTCFTVIAATKGDRFSRESVRGWLKELEGIGVVEVLEGSRGNKPALWTLVEPKQRDDDGIPFGQDVPSCDNLPASQPNLAQILGKTRDKSAVPSENGTVSDQTFGSSDGVQGDES